MCAEHISRMKLLMRLAQFLPEDVRPEFSQFIVGKEHLPPLFRRDVPLLRVVFPEKSFFLTASSQVRPEAQAALDLIAEALRGQASDVAVFVAGHTDDRGTTNYNYNLSVDRANAVALRLASMGIGPIALWRVGFGESVPLVPNDSEWNMSINRRVEFIFGARADPVAIYLQEQQKDLCAERDLRLLQTCKRIPERREFVAEALTTHTLVVTPVKRPMAMPGSDRHLTGTAPSNTHSMAVAQGGGSTLNVETPRRIILQLAPQQRRMALPTRF